MHPDFSGAGGIIQCGFMTSAQYVAPSVGPFEWQVNSLAISVDNGPLPTCPIGYALSAGNISVQPGPGIGLTTSFNDANPNAASALRVETDWGDATTSTSSALTFSLQTGFVDSANHIYAKNSTYSITASIIDSGGAATTVNTSFTGGLELDGTTLNDYVNGSPTPVDSPVQSFLVRNADLTTFSLHTDGSLWAVTGSGSQSVDGDVKTILLFPDLYTLIDLHKDGLLYYSSPGESPTAFFAGSNIQTITEGTNGTIYLLSGGSLDYLPAGGSAYVVANQPGQTVTSMALTHDGSALDVRDTAGDYWHFDGTSWILLSGPHFTLSVPGNPTAGQASSVTVTVLDNNNQPVTGYTGIVHFTSSDSKAQLPADYTFTSATKGHTPFPTLLRSSRRTARQFPLRTPLPAPSP